MKTSTKIILVTVLVLVGVFLLFRHYSKAPVVGEKTGPVTTTQVLRQISGDTANLLQFSVAPDATVANGQKITGTLSGSYFYEGSAIVSLVDANQVEIKTFPIMATSDWMTAGPVSFSFVLDTTGVPHGPGYIVLHNDNPSALPENDKEVDIPVVF